ncbi:glycosyltransferase family 4 protein [Thermoproteota archaeon]
MRYYLAFWIALAATWFLTPKIRQLALHAGLVDKPAERKLHKKPIPHLGGIAIYLGFLAAVLTVAKPSQTHSGIILGATLIVLLGVIDDIFHLQPWIKLLGQTAVAIITVYHGITISFITNPLGGMLTLDFFSFPITVFWIVAVMNTMNLIDGLDGLAAGIAAISSVILTIVAFHTGQTYAGFILLALLGACIGFLRYNFSPAQIFLGDSGAMLLGYILATASIIGVMKSTVALSLFIPVLVLGIPISDTLYAILRRIKNGKHIFKPDSEHFHHKLLALGFSHKQVVLLFYGLSTGLGIVAVLIGFYSF